MGVLLERARKVLGGGPRELPPAEPYVISCVCGQHVTGFRQDYRQHVRCSVCGHVHVVFPASAYPRPIVHEQPPPAERVRVQVVRVRRPLGLRVRIRLRRSRRAVVRLLWALVPPARWFSPVRLVIMATLLLVAGTIWLTVYWNRRGSLSSDLISLREAWTRDIEAGEFAEAQRKLNEAAGALKRFRGDTRDSREVEQLASEVSHIVQLLDRPLQDVLNAVRSMTDTQAVQYFRDDLKNPTLMVDSFVSPVVPSGPEPAGYRVDTRIVTESDIIRIDVSDLKLLNEFAPGVSSRVLFMARIQTIERGAGGSEWVLRVVPESGVLITSVTCLNNLGWPVDTATQAVLDAQAKWVLEER